MTKEYFKSRYRDYSNPYVANLNSYHIGTSFMGECVDHLFFVEPVNDPAFYEYIKNMEKKNLLPKIDWERYRRDLKIERVMFYKKLHENDIDASMLFAVSKEYFQSDVYKRWRLHEYPGNQFEDGDFKDEDFDRARCSLYLSGKAELLDRLIRYVGISFAEIPIDDPFVYDNITVFGCTTKSFDELVLLIDERFVATWHKPDGLVKPAQSLYSAWTTVALTWFHSNYPDLYDACYRQSVTDRKAGYLKDYYYWSDELGRT